MATFQMWMTIWILVWVENFYKLLVFFMIMSMHGSVIKTSNYWFEYSHKNFSLEKKDAINFLLIPQIYTTVLPTIWEFTGARDKKNDC